MGKSKYKKEFPSIVFLDGEKYGGSVFGEYTNYNNEIKIWWKTHSTSKEITSTMIHEYAHYLQFWPWYIRYMKKYPYDKNPYEVEATELSKFYEPEISKYSSEEDWKKLIKSNKKLKKIHESISRKISIKV